MPVVVGSARNTLKAPYRAWRARPARVRDGLREVAGRPETTEDERELLLRIDPAIHQADAMYLGDPSHYFWVGRSALRCIDAGREAAQSPPPARVLDFAGGYGRVLRFLRAAYPDAEIDHEDTDRRAHAFCARQFGAGSPEGRYDLIWCGSLITHLDADDTALLLRQFASMLAPGGCAVFSTHGAFAATHPDTLAPLAPSDREAVVAAFERTGFGYADYPGLPGYGASFTSPDWIERTATAAGLRRVWTSEQAWANHQDAHAFVAAQSSESL